MTVLVWTIVAMLLAAALLVLWRMVTGPTVLNRTLASDVLVAVIICALGAEAVVRDHSTTLPVLVSLSLVGFVATVAVSRFVAGDSDLGLRQAGQPGSDVLEPNEVSGFDEDRGVVDDDRGNR